MIVEKINRALLTILIILVSTTIVLAQTDREALREIELEISTQILQQTGYEYYISAYSFDDPYSTLEESLIFTAFAPRQDDGNRPNGFIGIYKDRNIIWQSEKEIDTRITVNVDIIGVLDLNQNKKVEIITQWYMGMRGGHTDLWIYSWDGETGQRINATNEKGDSQIQLQDHSIQLVDFEPDGIKEIIGIDRSDNPVVHSWNGQYYLNENKPQPDQLPRDALNAKVVAKVDTIGNRYRYSYIITNQQESLQSLEEFALQNLAKQPSKVITPKNWTFHPNIKYKLVSWQVSTFLKQHPKALLQPSESDTSFVFESSGLPRPALSYLKGNNGELNFDIDDLVKNSIFKTTLSPWLPDSSISPQDFTDTLKTFRHRACEELYWVTNHGVCNSLEVKIRNVKRHIERGQLKQAGNVLRAFLNEVEAQRGKHITEEGYALLYFNGRYLRDQLNEPSED